MRAIVLDPVFRGSRLTSSAWLARSLVGAGYQVEILTRKLADISHYHEVFADIPHVLNCTLSLPSDLWYFRVGMQVACETLIAIESGNYDVAVVTGWDEYLPALPIVVALYGGPRTRNVSWFLCDYSPEVQLAPEFRTVEIRWQKTLLRDVCEKLWSLASPLTTMFYADERIFTSQVRKKRSSMQRKHLPDPTPVYISPAVHRFRSKGRKIRFLLLGRQDRRKGLADILNAVEACPRLLEIFDFKLVGALTNQSESFANQLKRLERIGLIWERAYLSEEAVSCEISMSDYVLIPYTREFVGSSGVFSYAMAHGKPVISTAHGCVGYRVQSYRCGFVYESKDIAGLVGLLEAAGGCSREDYLKLVENCKIFHAENSNARFVGIVFEALGNIRACECRNN